MQQYDVVIVGAGPAGLCLARALAPLGLRLAVVERQPRASLADPPFDGREIALTHASMRLLRDLGIWQRLPADGIHPLRRARVMDRGLAQAMVVEPAREHDRLGNLVPNHLIRRAAWEAVQDTAGIDVYDEARIEAVQADPVQAGVQLASGVRLQARLLVAADSRFSETRRALGITADLHDFGKSMLVTRMRHERPHGHTAWEWFGTGQTVALLPLDEHLSSVVVTLPGERVRALAALDDAAFARAVEDLYGGRLGTMAPAGTRHVYPLVATWSRRFVGPRLALVGDAAVGMHPVTAHGFNLGLAGIERLADELRTGVSQGSDPGDPALLARYQRRHRRGSRPLFQATRAIVGVYTSDHPAAHALRGATLRTGARLAPFRRLLAAALTDAGPVDAGPLRRLRSGLSLLRPD